MSADKISRAALIGQQSGKTMLQKIEALTAQAKPKPSGPFNGLVIHEVTPGPRTSIEHPCFAGRHRWAYLTNGKVACGYCGTPRI